MSFDNYIKYLTQEQVDFIFKNGKRSSILFNFDFKELTLSSFEYVKEIIPNAFTTGEIELMIFKGLKERGINVFLTDISNLRPEIVMQFICWVKDELELISALENQYLASEPDMELVSSGIEQLNIFGSLNTIDSLAGGDILKWNEVKKLPYHLIFDKQYKSIIEKGIEKRLIASREAKSKNR